MSPRADLLDLNVWLALIAAAHPFHERALRYWHEQAGVRLAFCRVTALGLLRLLTNTTVMSGQPLSPAEAWSAYEAWRAAADVVLLDEPLGSEPLLAEWARHGRLHPRLWTDAYLAAFARAGDLRLVSFDRDFERFEGLDWLHLAP